MSYKIIFITIHNLLNNDCKFMSFCNLLVETNTFESLFVCLYKITKYRNCSILMSSAYGIAKIYVTSVQIKSKHLEDQKPIDV